MIRVLSYPSGPRCWIAGQRVHHGATGCLLAAVALRARRRRLLVVGALLAVHDRHDVRQWFRREGPPR